MTASPALRRAALARLERGRDARAAEVVRRSLPEVHERAGAGWESSEGSVRAIDVRLRVDGYALGLCHASPGVLDAVTAAIAAEAPDVLGASVVELTVAWGVAEPRGSAPYRDEELPVPLDRASERDVERAIAMYLAATGAARTPETEAAARVALGG